MSKIVTTEIGRFNYVTDGKVGWFLWECPSCLALSTMGELSLSRGCKHIAPPVEELWKALVVTMQVRIVMGESPTDLDNGQVYMPGSQIT